MTSLQSNLIWLVIGTVIGLVAGIAIYWTPLGQLCNEWRALWNLTRKRYRKGDMLTARAGTDMKPLDSKLPTKTVLNNYQLGVWNDEGVGWHHTSSGWQRTRIIHVYDPQQQGIQDVYKICHLDIVI